jgi:hypothetical protein
MKPGKPLEVVMIRLRRVRDFSRKGRRRGSVDMRKLPDAY